MLTGNKIAKNGLWIIFCKIVQSVLGMVVTMITARYLGPSNYGLINYAASIIAFVTPLMQVGLDGILVQEIINNKDEEGNIIGTSLSMSLCSSVLCIVGVFSFTLIANHDEKQTIIVCVLYSIVLIFQALEMIQYWFYAKLMAKYVSLTMLGAYIIISLYKIFIIISGKSIYWFALSNAIDYAIISIILITIYIKLGNQKLSFSMATAKRLFSKGKYYIVANMMVTIFAQTDKIMLKFILNDEIVGYYSAAVTCASMTAFVFVAIIDSARPVIFESKKESQLSFETNMTLLYSIIIYFALIQSFVITILANIIVLIIYGNQYINSVLPLRIIVWYTTFSYIGAIRNIWMLAENKQKHLWIINLSGAILNVILNLIFIPLWGINGAALTSLLTQIFTNVILGYIIKPIRYNNKLMLKGLSIKNLYVLLKKVVKK